MELTRVLHIKIDPQTLEKVRKLAKEHGISVSAWTRILLENHLRNPSPVVLEELTKRRRA